MRTLISVPLFHVTGCNAQLMLALHVGGTAVIMPELDQAGVLTALGEEQISYLVRCRPSTHCCCDAPNSRRPTSAACAGSGKAERRSLRA